ncbi:MAG: hypothetical protein JXB18_11810 [Sedimentisphaerales bacterium]|nr:hypothetical protein [Sedimentisphaerales bacterium]
METKKSEMSGLDIIQITLICILVFCWSSAMFFGLYMSIDVYPSSWFWGPAGLLIIFGFDAVWFLAIQKVLKKYLFAKVIIISLGFGSSTPFLILWISDRLFGHIF